MKRETTSSWSVEVSEANTGALGAQRRPWPLSAGEGDREGFCEKMLPICASPAHPSVFAEHAGELGSQKRTRTINVSPTISSPPSPQG